MIELLAAFQFLTSIPPLIKRPFTAQELGRSVGWYSLVGLALGGIYAGLAALTGGVLSPVLIAVILLIISVVGTRALHLDGWMDTCDGLFGGFTAERRLEIMRDSRVGAFGVAGGVLLLLIKFALLTELSGHLPALLLFPVAGRWAITLALVGFPYARQTGMGRDLKDHARWPQFTLATGIAALAIILAVGWWGLALLAGVGLAMLLWLLFVRTKIPGLTGDIYGATCELAEVLTLFALLMIMK